MYVYLPCLRPIECKGGYACMSGQCVHADAQCDGVADCDFGEDERHCRKLFHILYGRPKLNQERRQDSGLVII